MYFSFLFSDVNFTSVRYDIRNWVFPASQPNHLPFNFFFNNVPFIVFSSITFLLSCVSGVPTNIFPLLFSNVDSKHLFSPMNVNTYVRTYLLKAQKSIWSNNKIMFYIKWWFFVVCIQKLNLVHWRWKIWVWKQTVLLTIDSWVVYTLYVFFVYYWKVLYARHERGKLENGKLQTISSK